MIENQCDSQTVKHKLDMLWNTIEKENQNSGIDRVLFKEFSHLIKVNSIFTTILENPNYRCLYLTIPDLTDEFETENIKNDKKSIYKNLKKLLFGHKLISPIAYKDPIVTSLKINNNPLVFNNSDLYGVVVHGKNPNSGEYSVEAFSKWFAFFILRYFPKLIIDVQKMNYKGLLIFQSILFGDDKSNGLISEWEYNAKIKSIDKILFAYYMERNFNIRFYCDMILKTSAIASKQHDKFIKLFKEEIPKNIDSQTRKYATNNSLPFDSYWFSLIEIISRFWSGTKNYIVFGQEKILDLPLTLVFSKNINGTNSEDEYINRLRENQKQLSKLHEYIAKATNDYRKKINPIIESIQDNNLYYDLIEYYWTEIYGYEFMWLDEFKECLSSCVTKHKLSFNKIVKEFQKEDIYGEFREEMSRKLI